MKTLLRNALIVTMNENNDVIEHGAIAVDGKQISYVGPAEWTPAGPFDRIIDAERLIAIGRKPISKHPEKHPDAASGTTQ